MDDGFKKPFEYFEEKRGFIFIFIVMILFADIFLSLACIVQVHGILRKNPVLGTGFLILGFLFILFILYTAMNCYKLKKHMVTIAKLYLIVRAVFMIGSLIAIFVRAANDKSMIGAGPLQYESMKQMVLMLLLGPLAYDIVFSGGWYLYFLKSKKCRDFVKREAECHQTGI